MSCLLSVIFFAVVTLLSALWFTWVWKYQKKLPPGPWGLPIVGHLIFLGLRPYKTLMTWKEKYGPIIYGRMGSFPCVFLCDSTVIKEAFAKTELSGRGDIDAMLERPERKGIILGEGPRQVEQRRFALKKIKDFGSVKETTASRTTKMEGYIQEALAQFIVDIEVKGRGGQGVETVNLMPPYVISSLYRVLMTDKIADADAKFVQTSLDTVINVGPNLSTVAMFMPWVETLTRLFTLGRVSVTSKRVNSLKAIYRLMEVHIERRRQSWVKGQPRDVVDEYLDLVDDADDKHSAFYPSHGSIAYFAGDLMIGGVHSTSATMEWTFLYMATCPLVQKKLAQEIDDTLGPTRLPTLKDRSKLSYVEATICEILRLSSIFPLGVEHKSLIDTTLQDFHIPKGTLIMANIYGEQHDPKIWGMDVEEFKPERWLQDPGKKWAKNAVFRPFSIGKRSCIGETFARDSLFIFITGIFQKFNIAFEAGCSGPGFEPVLGLSLAPRHFKVVFTPRNGE